MTSVLQRLEEAQRLAGAGDRDGAVEVAEAAKKLAIEQQDGTLEIKAWLVLARLHGRTAHWRRTDRALFEAERAADAYGIRSMLVEALVVGLELAIDQDGSDAVEKLGRLRRAAEGQKLPDELLARAYAVQAWYEARGQQKAEAARGIYAASRLLRDATDVEGEARARLTLARAWVELDQSDRGVGEAAAVLTLGRRARRDDLCADARRALGLANATIHDPRVARLLTVATEVARSKDLAGVLDAICTATASLVDVDRVFVVLKEPDGELRVGAAASRWGDPGLPSMSIVRRTLRLGREVIATDAAQHESMAAASVVQMALNTVMCVPLGDTAERVVGVIYADSTRVPRQAAEDAIWLLRALGAHAAVAVSNARSFELAQRREQAARETIHDVRSLVCAIKIGLEDVTAGAELAPWVTEVLDTTQRMTDSVLRQVEGALGRREAPATKVEVGPIATEIARFLEPEARRKGCTLQVRAKRAGPVCMDADDLGRVLTNLISNAVKYSPPDAVVDVLIKADDDRVFLTVTDRGQGIADADRERVFEAGFQAPGAAPGHGLGLGICHRLVSTAGGKIEAAPAPEGGTQMKVVLPRWRGTP